LLIKYKINKKEKKEDMGNDCAQLVGKAEHHISGAGEYAPS
jgi:hypothetical protein